jgi:hypothetical protein
MLCIMCLQLSGDLGGAPGGTEAPVGLMVADEAAR